MDYTDGTMKFTVINNKSGGVLPGTILAFSGEFNTDGYPIDKLTGFADKGWHLCDGTNGTPDLRGRFILGASDAHTVGSTGGEESHQLTESELPRVTVTSTGTTTNAGSHKHNINTGNATSTAKNDRDWVQCITKSNIGNPTNRTTEEAGTHKHGVTVSGTFGGGQAHSIMPPYYTLAFIMKI